MDNTLPEFKDRLKRALSLREMTPGKLAKKTGISKSSISQYMSGYTRPKQDKIFLISKVLNISEAWLAGFDVPMEKDGYEDQTVLHFDIEFENAINIIESEGYLILFVDDSYCDYFVVKDKNSKIITQMYDYELVIRYEYLLRKNIQPITAKDLLFDNDKPQTSETRLVTSFRKLNSVGKGKAVEYVEDLKDNPKYAENTPVQTTGLIAAHNENTDPDQLEKMNQDIENIKKLKAKKQ